MGGIEELWAVLTRLALPNRAPAAGYRTASVRTRSAA